MTAHHHLLPGILRCPMGSGTLSTPTPDCPTDSTLCPVFWGAGLPRTVVDWQDLQRCTLNTATLAPAEEGMPLQLQPGGMGGWAGAPGLGQVLSLLPAPALFVPAA